MQANNIYSISQLNANARQLLERNFCQIWLTGEISNFTQPVSGHWYLTLKDENAQVRAAMFRMKNMTVAFRPQNGMQVLVRANVSLYEPRGDYQLIIESMYPAGEGLLQQQFEALKVKLAAEGLFAQHLKKNLPHFCKKVGVITSPTGAALQDILYILKRRDPSLQIVIYPTAVQGKEASAEIVQMINLANRRQEVDVLIVGRGGGSLEDLYCFNEEIVARTIFHSNLPIISAVGHETDVTIADFVADIRAPTPSAAAELVSRDQNELLKQLQYQQQRLEITFDHLFQHKSVCLQQTIIRLKNQHPKTKLQFQQQQIQSYQQRLMQAIWRLQEKNSQKLTALLQRIDKNPLTFKLQARQHQIVQLNVRLIHCLQQTQHSHKNKLANLCGKLDSLSPLKVLSRGYSIAQTEEKKPITTINQVNIGDYIHTKVKNGVIRSQVIEKYSKLK